MLPKSIRIQNATTGAVITAEEWESLQGETHVLLDVASASGRLLPTGTVSERFSEGPGSITFSVIDAGEPFVFAFASELGLGGIELPDELAENLRAVRVTEELRRHVQGRLSLPCPPGVVLVAPPMTCPVLGGEIVRAAAVDVTARLLTEQGMHPAYTSVGAICTAAAAAIEGTVVSEVARSRPGEVFRVGHPSGIVECEVSVVRSGSGLRLARAVVGSTVGRVKEELGA